MIPETEEYHYAPGNCNIGKVEINRRYRIGFIGLGLMLILIACIRIFQLPGICKWGLFFPAFYSISGFVQGFYNFCYVYGLKGLASLTGRKKFQRITDKVAFQEDRKKAFFIISIVTLSSAALTIFYVRFTG